MSSFLNGLMSVGRKLGKGVESWAQGTKVGRDIDKIRGSSNPWSKSNNSNQAGTSNKPSDAFEV